MYQKITIVGNLGRDPEMRYTPGGQAVTNLNIATNRQYTSNSGERVKETTWFRVSVWGKQAESCNQYLKSGSKVLVEGRMNQDKETGGPRIWTRNDGSAGASFEITAQTVRFLSSRQEDQAAGGGGNVSGGNSNYGAGNAMEPPQEDEIPF
ncbi:MAG: single-stranded DNA-binding protein [Anaerolineae bacterium]|jgi:single-strand DNA-binding protein|nr:single-stranded DNA-binding protein [Anaerolineae bacterium]MBT7075918.1 single-stranded DNA-binding protein [Anaerolineae bacterium]MBT7782991.1 single-stranded DNA-binding protein [Anaerolineae bacterium]